MYSGKIMAETARDVFYFPLWWYGRGLVKTLIWLKNFLAGKQKTLALLIWIKNLHRPMYGQYDWKGILISFFMRLFQIFVRSLVMLAWLIVALVMLFFWLALPPLVIYEIFFQLFL